MNSVDIFLKTYVKDLPWFRWVVASIKAFWKEDGVLIVNCDPESTETVHSICCGLKYRVVEMVQWGNGKEYIFQQYTKLIADTCTQAKVVVFLDSDCVITRPFGLGDLMDPETGRIQVLCRSYGDLGGAEAWQGIVHRAMNVRPELEFMCRHPFCYATDSLTGLRKYLEGQHLKSLHDYMVNLPGRNFTEFNCLGFYCWLIEPHRYTFRRTDLAQDAKWIAPPLIRQFHSWTEDAEDARRAFEQAIAANAPKDDQPTISALPSVVPA